MKRFFGAIACAVILASAAPVSASASTLVSVKLNVTIGEPLVAAPVASCSVEVPAGADGIAMLNAAVSTGCIDSYETAHDPTFGNFIIAIDRIRGLHEAQDITYWRLGLNGDYATTGIDGFRAANGQVYSFSYSEWLVCFTPVGC